MEKEGATVYLTRSGDYDLASTTYYRKRSDLGNRARMINNSNCDLYLSIHLNSSLNSTWNGAQVFYDDINPKNKELILYIFSSNIVKRGRYILGIDKEKNVC